MPASMYIYMHHLCTYNIWLIAYARHVYKMLVKCNTDSLLEIINKLIDMHVLCLIRFHLYRYYCASFQSFVLYMYIGTLRMNYKKFRMTERLCANIRLIVCVICGL
jgi:hypothetical protein